MSASPSLPPSSSVRIENVSPDVTTSDIQKLFQDKIGHVVSVTEHAVLSTFSRWFEVTFDNPNASEDALTVRGHVLAGMPIHVTPMFDPDLLVREPPVAPPQDETRRNLYVLGLPHDYTLEEFKALFSRYGKVEHSVILAVLDNYSRRRGFVVFATHAEAKNAMRAVHKLTIKGHQLNVSWAVVQRSSGFLDGRTDEPYTESPQMNRKSRQNRASSNASTTTTASPVTPSNPFLFGSPLITSQSFDTPYAADSPASTLVIDDLCPWLFQEHKDVLALFAPYGLIKSISVKPSHPIPGTYPAGMPAPHTAVVEFEEPNSAVVAAHQVNMRPFGTCIVKVRMLKDIIQESMLRRHAASMAAAMAPLQSLLTSPQMQFASLQSGALDPLQTLNTYSALAQQQQKVLQGLNIL